MNTVVGLAVERMFDTHSPRIMETLSHAAPL
jgi:ribosomal protein L19